ncbi:MAG: sodium/solute symporter [Akkermansiaceae bacterium]|nr:sodium/solute symporter [Akkermansiaceae bacterium]MCP5551906.1 sodium/solute symporter [Akkermansiaceae bacterium]
METQLATLDYLILAVYLIGTVALGLAIGWKFKTGEDFFLAGRTLPWWAIGMSLVASDIGGTDIIGVGGAAYKFGLAVANFEWIGCVPAMIVAAFVFVPVFWRTGVYTIPEFMERRFNAGMRAALAFCWLIFMACNLGIMLFASAKMLHGLLDWSPAWCVWLTAALVGVYTFAGGLKAVVYTDVVQCAVMIGGCLMILVLGLADLGGWGGMMEKIHALGERTAHHGDLLVPADRDSPFVWPGILFGLALVLSPAYWIGNQAIVQRSLGAKSQFQAQAAYVWGALLKVLIPILVAIPGLIALAKFPDLADADGAFPALVSKLLPTGLRGLFLAAFVAALMSSVDSYLNAAATLVTNDFYRRWFRPGADDRRLLVVGRNVTVILMAWAIGFAFVVKWMDESGKASGIYAIFQTLMAFFSGPALATILCGFLWRRATGAGALAGFLCGVAVSVGLFVLDRWHGAFGMEPLFRIPEPFLYFSLWAFVSALVVTGIVSLLTKPEPPEKTAFLDGGGADA